MRVSSHAARSASDDDDDDVYYYIRWRLKLEGETENTGVCTKERKGITVDEARSDHVRSAHLTL